MTFNPAFWCGSGVTYGYLCRCFMPFRTLRLVIGCGQRVLCRIQTKYKKIRAYPNRYALTWCERRDLAKNCPAILWVFGDRNPCGFQYPPRTFELKTIHRIVLLTLKSCGSSPSFIQIPKKTHRLVCLFGMRETGLEPVRTATHAPQTCASADSATLANYYAVPDSESYYIKEYSACQYFFEKVFDFSLRLVFANRFCVSRRSKCQIVQLFAKKSVDIFYLYQLEN